MTDAHPQELSLQQLLDARLDDWRKLAQALHGRYLTPDYPAGAAFVAAVAEAAAAAGHQPELRLAPGLVDVTVGARRDGRSVTAPDVALARTVSQIARQYGLRADPGAVTQLELALDTADEHGIGPFWAVVLTGSPDSKLDDTILDPTGRVPNLWFQGTDQHPEPRQRWHLDLWLAPEVAAGRIAAALAVGGTVVDDSEAPSFTVLADQQGNKVCICTCLERG
jgi:4a-hydroxytetrahydrobiopterin dehydratase